MPEQYISTWEEHQFWLNMLQDHAYFVRDYLSPAETKYVAEADMYIRSFEAVLQHLQTVPQNADYSSPEMIELSQFAYQTAGKYYLFEGNILNLRLKNEININLTPTYFNGTLNENAEYLRILQYNMRGQAAPPLSLVDLLSLWLEDQLGHAVLLIRLVDGIEFDIVRQAEGLKVKFSQFIVKNNAIKGYLRFHNPGSPIQIRFAHEVAEAVVAFNELVGYTLKQYDEKSLVNQSTRRFLFHHFPEACYFMKKMSIHAPDLQYPPCQVTYPPGR
ncbi:DUF2935 domain-containing protein [Bacillus salacetis]|uniref:DUF2935 domain-containing protein n=1 Tax=Bacillus salacetis TaxID=2315464 RepID=UPI003B9F9BE9